MLEAKSSLILAVLFFGFIKLSAQENVKVNSTNYNAVHDSMIQQKQKLELEKTTLKISLDSLRAESKNLDEGISKTLDEIKQLFVKKFGKQNGNRLANKQVWKGMTDKMLQLSWGKPDKIDENVEKWGVFTQWYYGKITFFFKNGILIEWEEEKN